MIKKVILVSIITIILIYWFYLKSHKVEGFIGEEDESNNKPNNKSAVLTLIKDLQEKNEPPIYSEAYELSSKLSPMLKYNLKINNRLPEYDQNTEKMFQKI